MSATAFAATVAVAAQNFNYFFPSIGVRIFAISRTLGRYVERIFNHDATLRLLESLRDWFYRHIEPLAPARLMRFRSGDLLNRIVADIDALDRYTAQETMQRLLSLTRCRTLILITHQPFELHRMDQIAFMENGRVTSLGDHRTLRQIRPL